MIKLLKQFCWMLLWGLTLNNGFAQSLKELNVKGKFSKIQVTEYQIDDTQNGNTRKVEYQFNNQGNKTSEIISNEKGLWIYKNKLTYSPAGLLVKEQSSNKVTFQMDVTKKYSYNSNKQLIKIEVYEYRKHVINTIIYQYNQGKLISLKNTNARGELEDNITYRYNAQGLLAEETILDGQGNPITVAKYSYNDKGQKIEKSEYDNDFLTFTIVYQYDNRGNLVSEISSYTSGNATQIEYIYTYDQNGNWTHLRELMNGKTYAISSRIYIQAEKK